MREIIDRLAEELSLHPNTVRYLAGKNLAESPDATSIEELRHKMHPVYYNQFMYNLSHVQRSEKIYDLARNAVGDFSQNPSILDIGCGLGGVLIVFGKHDFKLHGIELGEKSREMCRDNLEFNGLTGELTAEDLCYDDLGGKKFDVVTCNSVVEHVDDPKSFISSFKDLLKPGGVLILGVANCEALGNLISDPHYQLFGMTLLPRAESAELYNIFAKVQQNYSVTDWYPIHEYADMIQQAVGPVNLVPPEGENRGSEAVPSLLSRFFGGLDQALKHPKLVSKTDLFVKFKEKALTYAEAVCQNVRQIDDLRTEENFKNRYIRKSFQFVATKE